MAKLIDKFKAISRQDWIFSLLPVLIWLPIYFMSGYSLIDEIMDKHMSLGGNDIEAVVALLAKYNDFYFKTGRHPLFLIFNPLGLLLNIFTGSPPVSALILTCAASGVSMILFYVLLRGFKVSAFKSFLFTLLLGGGCAHLVGGIFPETFVFTAMSILLLMVINIYTSNEKTFNWLFFPAGILAFGMAVTSLAPVGIIILVRYWKNGILNVVKRGIIYVLGIILFTAGLAYIQALVYDSNYFLSGNVHFSDSITPYFGWEIINEPMLVIEDYLPMLVLNHTVFYDDVHIYVNNYIGHYTGDHLFAWPVTSGSIWRKIGISAYVMMLIISIFGASRHKKVLSSNLMSVVLYLGFVLLFHLIFDPLESHVFATLYTFPQIALMAVACREFNMQNRQFEKGLNVVLVILVAVILLGNLDSLYHIVDKLQSFPWG